MDKQGCFSIINYFQISLRAKYIWILLLRENYPDIARCCYYEYHYLWQVVRMLNFWCQPIRVQDYGNWPIRGKNSLCRDKCWQWGASFLQPEQNTIIKGQNESLLIFHQTWHEQCHLEMYMALCAVWEISRTDLGEGWPGIRIPIGDGVAAKFSFSPGMMSSLHFLPPSPPSILNRCWQKPQLQLGVQLQRSIVSTI